MTDLRIVGITTAAHGSSGEFAQLLANEAPDLPIYVFRPTPGVIMGAAFDWTVVLSAAANVVAVAGGIWAAYKHFAKKHPSSGAANTPQVILQVKAEPHSFVQIVVNNATTQEQFTTQFVDGVSKLRALGDPEQNRAISASYEASPNEIRVHPNNKP
jgi:hypothetical protein